MPRNRSRKDSCRLCVVCCEEIEYFAIGQCDHPICHVCCVRMRVLGKENYCAVCRSDLDKVVLIKRSGKWSSIQAELDNGYVDRKLGLCYTSKDVRTKVKELLQHKCTKCPDRPPESNFDQLRDHMKKEHNLFYCNICIQHHCKFSHEWKLYNRTHLATHRRVGDPDDKSHKGHPICKFCEDRFLDDDELHRHLRKNHFWCHLCENDGKQLYFLDYPNLRNHFKEEHFLCEEDMCKYEQFTSVFRTEIDFQAHRASKHSLKMSKAQVRQARQLEVDLVYNQNSKAVGRTITGQDFNEVRANEHKSKQPKRKGNNNYSNRQEEADLQTAIKSSLKNNNKSRTPSPPTNTNTTKKDQTQMQLDHKDFPLLSGSTESSLIQPAVVKKPGRNINSLDDFPSLTSTSNTQSSRPPPPGFENLVKETSNTSKYKKPPPGLKKQSPPISKKSENPYPPLRTQNEPTVKTKDKAKKNTEIPKTDFQLVNKNSLSRNQAFIENVKMLLGSDLEKFTAFKTLSGKFRQGNCSAQEYYENCTALFESNFTFIFNELVSLLPDSEKQTELLAVHNDSKAVAKRNGTTVQSNGAKRPTVQVAWGPKLVTQTKTVNAPKEKMDPVSKRDLDFPSLPMAGPPREKAINIYRPNSTRPLKSAWVRGK